MRLSRSRPYITALLRASKNKRKRLLKSFPAYVADDIVEILYNLVHERIPMPRIRRKKLMEGEKRLVARICARAREPKARREMLYKQTGGFLGVILPILATVAGEIIRNATR